MRKKRFFLEDCLPRLKKCAKLLFFFDMCKIFCKFATDFMILCTEIYNL